MDIPDDWYSFLHCIEARQLVHFLVSTDSYVGLLRVVSRIYHRRECLETEHNI